MSSLASLTVTGKITAAGYEIAPLGINGIISPSTSQGYGLFPGIEGSVDTTILSVFIPGVEGGEQVLGRIKIEIGGVEVLARKTLAWFEMTEADDGAATWSFGVPYYNSAQTDEDDFANETDFLDPLKPYLATTGSISSYHGPPPGGDSVDISIVIPTASGTLETSLVTDGLAENADLQFSEDGVLMTVNGTGPMQRLDRKAVSLEIPAGHGMTMGEMVSWVMKQTKEQNADDWDYALPTIPIFFIVDDTGLLDERHRYKLIQATDSSGIELAQSLLEIVGHRLILDRYGDWKLNRTFDDDGATSWFFTLKDLLSAEGLSLQPNADGPPVVVFTGSEQDTIDDPDGLITKTSVVEISGIHTLNRPEYYISNGTTGALTSTGLTDVETDDLYYREITRHTYQGDTLVSRTTTLYSVNVFRLGQTGTTQAGDGSRNWVQFQNVFQDLNIAIFNHSWGTNWDRYSEEIESLIYEDVHDDGNEYLTTKIVSKWGYYYPRHYLANGWTGVYTLSIERLYDNSGLDNPAVNQDWMEISRETTRYEINEDGFIEVEEVEEESRSYLPPGDAYWYWDGRKSSAMDEEWGTIRTTRTTHSAEGDTHTKIITIEKDGQVIETRTETGEGYLPAASMKLAKKPTELSDGTLLPNSLTASPGDTDGFEVIYEDAELLTHRPRWEERISNEIVADADEGMVYARRHLRERATIPFTFAVPFNPLIKPTDWIEIDLGRRGEISIGTVRGKVVTVAHNYDREGGSMSTVEAKVFTV